MADKKKDNAPEPPAPVKPDIIPDADLPLGSISKAVNKSIGAQVLIPGGEANLSTIHTWVPTPLTLLNLFLYGGIPMGRFWEVFGEPSHGKTALVTALMIAIQRVGGVSIYLDAEGTWDEKRALSMGHNPARHMHLQADTVELGVRTIDETLDKFRNVHNLQLPLLFVWDTLAASQMDAEKDMKEAKTGEEKRKARFKEGMASKPRVVREALRRFSLEFPRQQAAGVFVNQTIADFDPYGPGFDTPGGGAVKFWSTYRIQVYRSGAWKPDNKTEAGILSTLKMVKCKVGPNMRKVELPLTWNHGWDEDYANFNYLTRSDAGPVAAKTIEQRGAYFYIHGPKDVIGSKEISLYRSQLHDKLGAHPGLGDYLREQVRAEWQASYAP